jgi:hypothetical protein
MLSLVIVFDSIAYLLCHKAVPVLVLWVISCHKITLQPCAVSGLVIKRYVNINKR